MDLAKDLLNLKSKLVTIENNFSEKLLKESEIEKEQLDKRLDEKLNAMVKSKSSPLVNLNIGGKVFSTKLSTLLSCKESLFYKDLVQYQEEGTTLPEMIFYDRAYTHFELFLNYFRYNRFSIKGFKPWQKEEIRAEVLYYGLEPTLQLGKREDYDVSWDRTLSRQDACTISSEDPKSVRIHSTTCSTHFVTNKLFTDEDFQIELEVAVTQTDDYLYVGLFNNTFQTTTCCCGNPQNTFFIKCDGTIHINGGTISDPRIRWNSQTIIVGMKVFLSEGQKRLFFYFPDKGDLELGPYTLVGTGFRVYAGHCNTGNGNIRILDCYSCKE